MTRAREDERLRRVLLLAAREAPRGPDCLSDDLLAALAEGSLEERNRPAALRHIAECAFCRSAVASVARAMADSAVTREVGRLDRTGRKHFLRIAVPAVAAAAVIVLISWPPPPGGPEFAHRAPTIAAGTAPAPVAPVGAVAQGSVFRWSPVDGADRYRVTLFDADGHVRYETELPTATMALPDSVVLIPGRPYLWKVEARLGFDRWATSELVEFSITRPASP